MNIPMKKYAFPAAVIIINLLVLMVFPPRGIQSLVFTGKAFSNFLFSVTPVFICIGLLDEWIEKTTMVKMMGEGSGGGGILMAFAMGIISAVPLYALLPVSGMLLKKKCAISNVLMFICSSASIRIPLLLFQLSSLGWKFTVIWLAVNTIAVLLIGCIVEKMLSPKDRTEIYTNAAGL